MKRAVIVGFISGLIAGVVQAGLAISGFWELFVPYWLGVPVSIQHTILFFVTLMSLWGIVHCALYAFFYEYIPYEGVKKGLIFGLIIWVAAALLPASISAGYGFGQYFVPWTFSAFISTCLVYGSLIGILYKKE